MCKHKCLKKITNYKFHKLNINVKIVTYQLRKSLRHCEPTWIFYRSPTLAGDNNRFSRWSHWLQKKKNERISEIPPDRRNERTVAVRNLHTHAKRFLCWHRSSPQDTDTHTIQLTFRTRRSRTISNVCLSPWNFVRLCNRVLLLYFFDLVFRSLSPDRLTFWPKNATVTSYPWRPEVYFVLFSSRKLRDCVTGGGAGRFYGRRRVVQLTRS